MDLDIKRKHWVLIQRYVTGNANPEERKFLKQWMGQNPENRKLVQELEEIWDLSPSEKFNVDVEAAWKKFQTRKPGAEVKNSKPAAFSGKRSKMPLYLVRAAAAILLVVFTGYFIQHTLPVSDAEKPGEFYVMQTFETEKGEKARVTFSDGTKVTLNSASKIQFPEEFHGPKREVYLEGEAFFEVAHDSGHPFIVHAQNAEVEVLGTEFNVRGWKEDPAVEVAVREGKVAVVSSEEQLTDRGEIILTEGLLTQVNKGEKPAPVQRINMNNYLLWTHGGLHFDNAPFKQVIRDLERRFDIRIGGVEEDLMNTPFTGTFQYADLSEILSVVAVAMDLEFRREGPSVEFSSAKSS